MSTPNDGASIGPVEAFWRFRGWTVPVTLVVGILAALAALATSGTSTASTTLYLTDPRGTPVFREGSTNPTDLNRFARQRAAFAESALVRQEIANRIEILRESDPNIPSEDPVELEDVIEASTTSSSDVNVTCTTVDDARSLRICDELVEAYLALTVADTTARAEAAVTAYLADRARIIAELGPDSNASAADEIDLKIAEVRSAAALYGSGVEFFDPPEVNEDSRLLPAVQFGLAGALFAGFAMAALAWFRAGRRPIVLTSTDAVNVLNAPLLGEISDAPEGTFSPAAPPGADYQLLATSLSAVQPTGGVVLASTPHGHSGAAETIGRTAAASAREGRRVLVVDGDLRSRDVSRLFGYEDTTGGLTEVLANLAGLDQVRRTVGVGGAATLDFVTGGRAIDDPSSLFRSAAARTLLETMRGEYDLVLVAVPPLLAVADGSALAGQADGVMLIVPRNTESHDLDTVRQRLDVLRTRVLGVVFDHRTRDAAK